MAEDLIRNRNAGDYANFDSVARASVPTFAAVALVIAALYLGRDVFLPLAIALLLTFALAPLASRLRRLGLPRPAAVIFTVLTAFAAILLFLLVVATQISDLARNLPTYQTNIETKIETIRDAGTAEGSILSRLGNMIERLAGEIRRPAAKQPTPPQAADEPAPAPAGPLGEQPDQRPVPVEVVNDAGPLDILQNFIVPLISPFATAGLVLVVVIFMLLEREDLRDRFIRLVGSSDLHRTTQALQDAGDRLGRYLLAQLLINTLYAVPLGIGLWLIGIPNALLWGLLGMVLRFVPYIGPIITAAFPLALSLAVAPGWSLLLWTIALFVIVELITNNILEPWIYGSRTGLSPLAVILAAILWTFLWGPLGLVLSTPLTACLVVLGRHVPQFEFLDVMFGNEPVLAPHMRLYQRLLAGDPQEATDNAEEYLEDRDLVDYYGDVAVPALLLAERDRSRGALEGAIRQRLLSSIGELIDNLEEIADAESAEVEEPAGDGNGAGTETDDDPRPELPDGEGFTLLCAGGRTDLDDCGAAMLAQVLTVQGATVQELAYSELAAANIRKRDLGGVDTVILGYFATETPASHARIQVRRLKRLQPRLRVGLVFWGSTDLDQRQTSARLSADFVATDMRAAALAALTEAEPVALAGSKRKPRRAASRKRGVGGAAAKVAERA